MSEQKQEYVTGRLAGKNRTQAALAAGYSPATARIATQVVETPEVKAVFRSLVQRSLPMQKLADRLAEGLDAVSTQFFQKDGIVMDQRDTIAWSERRAYLELAAEYAGYVEKDGAALTVQIGSLSVAMPEGDAGVQSVQAQPVLDVQPVDAASIDAALPASSA